MSLPPLSRKQHFILPLLPHQTSHHHCCANPTSPSSPNCFQLSSVIIGFPTSVPDKFDSDDDDDTYRVWMVSSTVYPCTAVQHRGISTLPDSPSTRALMKRLLAKPAPISYSYFSATGGGELEAVSSRSQSYAEEGRVVVLASHKGRNERWRREFSRARGDLCWRWRTLRGFTDAVWGGKTRGWGSVCSPS